MIYFGLLLFFIGILIKKKIIHPTTLQLWGNNSNSNTSAYGLFIVSAFIILITLVDNFIPSSRFLNYFNVIYIIIVIIAALLVISIVIIHYKNRFSIIICLIILCILGTLLYNTIKQPKLEIIDNKFKFHSIFSYTIKMSDIDSVWISNKDFKILHKVKGADLANYYRGVFFIKDSNKESVLFINKSKNTYIYLLLKDKSQIIYNNIS